MKRTAFYQWYITSDTSGKRILTSYKMSEAVALERHPEAVKDEGSLEWRELPEPGDDANHNRARGH